MLVFSDLHLKESSEKYCAQVLDWIRRFALLDDRHVVCCGDFWHLRYTVLVRLLNMVHAELDRWGKEGIQLTIIPGNHDQVNVAGMNALEVFGAHPNVMVCTVPREWRWGGLKLLGVPYRADPEDQVAPFAKTNADLAFSHFAVNGSARNDRSVCVDGLTVPAKGWPPLILGHYHKRQQAAGAANKMPAWQYVGSPYQTSFGEAGNDCGVLRVKEAGGRPVVDFVPVDLGIPKHYIVQWDPVTDPAPPPRPGTAVDRVRLDVRATPAALGATNFKKALKGWGSADVNVIPQTEQREVRFAQAATESLVDVAHRFVGMRTADAAEYTRLTALLKRWV